MTDVQIRVLVIDDERAIRRLLKAILAAHQYEVYESATAQAGLAAIRDVRPDLVILDMGLPDLDGLEVVQIVRSWSSVPIIVLSVRDQEQIKIAALDAGADDYLTKPFGSGELLARLRVALRRAGQSTTGEPIFRSGALQVDLERRLVQISGQEVQLTPTEYDLLRVLVNHAGKVLTHGYLLRTVWGVGYADELHLLRVNISNLRRKLEADPTRPHLIITEPGVGYRLRLSE